MISGLNAIEVPLDRDSGADASAVTAAVVSDELDPPPLSPQLTRHETIREESNNLSNCKFIVLYKASSARPRIPLMLTNLRSI